jgi:hypothetical protein
LLRGLPTAARIAALLHATRWKPDAFDFLQFYSTLLVGREIKGERVNARVYRDAWF